MEVTQKSNNTFGTITSILNDDDKAISTISNEIHRLREEKKRLLCLLCEVDKSMDVNIEKLRLSIGASSITMQPI
jgi:archaellum component FlaC